VPGELVDHIVAVAADEVLSDTSAPLSQRRSLTNHLLAALDQPVQAQYPHAQPLQLSELSDPDIQDYYTQARIGLRRTPHFDEFRGILALAGVETTAQELRLRINRINGQRALPDAGTINFFTEKLLISEYKKLLKLLGKPPSFKEMADHLSDTLYVNITTDVARNQYERLNEQRDKLLVIQVSYQVH